MKAMRIHGINDLRVEDLPVPEIKEGEALLKVLNAGICGSDVLRYTKEGAHKMPLILGHEFSAEIAEIKGEGKGFNTGDKVTVFPLMPCNTCSSCRDKEYAMCENYDYLGSRSDGGFAEYCRAPVWNLEKLPEGVTPKDAAMSEPAAVALHCIRRSGIKEGDKVVIIGAGPIGSILSQLAHVSGAARVIMIDIIDEKLKFAGGFKADKLINSKQTDPVKEVLDYTAGGADIVIEGVGSPFTANQAIDMVARKGTVMLMGNMNGDCTIPMKRWSSILRKQITLVGTWNSSRNDEVNDWADILKYCAEGKLKLAPLVTHEVLLDKAIEVFNMMKENKTFYSKVMFDCQG